MAMQAMQAPVAATIFVVLLMLSKHLSSLAATSGRMGGHSYSFSSSSSSSFSSSSSYSSSSWRSKLSSWSSSKSCFDNDIDDIVRSFILAFCFIIFPICWVLIYDYENYLWSHISVIKLQACTGFDSPFCFWPNFKSRFSDFFLMRIIYQVGLLDEQVKLAGIARSLQQDLDKIAENADISTPKGFHYILTGKPKCFLCSTFHLQICTSIIKGDRLVCVLLGSLLALCLTICARVAH